MNYEQRQSEAPLNANINTETRPNLGSAQIGGDTLETPGFKKRS